MRIRRIIDNEMKRKQTTEEEEIAPFSIFPVVIVVVVVDFIAIIE